MKDELVNSIVCMLDSMDVETDGIADRLYILLRNYEIKPVETQLAIRDDSINEHLLKRFLAAKMVKGCTKRTIDRYRKQISWTLNRINKTVTEITADDVRYYIALRLTQDRISKVSANNEILCLRTFFAWLNVEEIIPVNPMNKVDRIKADKVKKKAFTDLECEKIRASCRSRWKPPSSRCCCLPAAVCRSCAESGSIISVTGNASYMGKATRTGRCTLRQRRSLRSSAFWRSAVM